MRFTLLTTVVALGALPVAATSRPAKRRPPSSTSVHRPVAGRRPGVRSCRPHLRLAGLLVAAQASGRARQTVRERVKRIAMTSGYVGWWACNAFYI